MKPLRVQKSMLHFGGMAVPLLGKHSSLYGILNICLFLPFCSGLDFIDYMQNTPNISILVFGPPGLTEEMFRAQLHPYLIALYWH